jgi:serine/threonine protein phosphatase 1
MAGRTFAVGDIHGDFVHLQALFGALPPLDDSDTIVFLGDYLDRGPQSADVVQFVRSHLPRQTGAKIVALRGSHEDAWLKVRKSGWPEFVIPVGNGCLATLRSFGGQAPPAPDEMGKPDEIRAMLAGSFFPDEVVSWLESLPTYYEDEHAIYVHAGLPRIGDSWTHPSQLSDPKPLMWERSEDFFRSYRGKRVVFGHTIVEALPQESSIFTPEDKTDVYLRDHLVGIDTCCGHGGFLTAVELPRLLIYESRRVLAARSAGQGT